MKFLDKVERRKGFCHSPPWAIRADVVAVCLIVVSPAWALSIDGFADGDFSDSQAAPGSSLTTQAGSMIGGEREVTLTWTSGGVVDIDDVEAIVNPAVLNVLNWNMDDAIIGNLGILYDGVGTPVGGLGDVDLTDAGLSSEFLIKHQFGDGSAVKITITVVSGGGTSVATKKFASTIATDVLMIPFSDLVGGADLTAVDSIDYLFTNDTGNIGLIPDGGGDYKFDILGTGVPEPATLALLLLGGLALLRRRK